MDVSTLLKFLDKYSMIVGGTLIQPIVLTWVALFMMCLCVVRSISVIKMSKVQVDSASVWYVFSVEFLCWLFGCIVAVFLVCVSGNPSNLVMNCVVFPVAGFLSSLWFEGIVIQEMNKKVLDRYDNSSSKDKSKSKGILDKLVGDRASSPVIINIDSAGKVSSENRDSQSQYIGKLKTLEDMLKKPSDDEYITKDDLDNSKSHSELFSKAINDLIDNQYSTAVELKNHLNLLESQSEELKMQSAILVSVRDTMMVDKKFKLKKLMYDCLNQGYVTPAQNEVITADYCNYESLGGNGEVKELYENHYLKLPIHEDRRCVNVDVPVDRRQSVKCECSSVIDGIYIPNKGTRCNSIRD